MLQEIYFSNLYNFRWESRTFTPVTRIFDTLRKLNRVYVMVVNKIGQDQMYKQFLKEVDLVILYQSPLGVNRNYGRGSMPRNFVVVWEFQQPSVAETEISQLEASSKDTQLLGVAAESGTPPVPAVELTEKTLEETISSISKMGVRIASPATTMMPQELEVMWRAMEHSDTVGDW